MNLPLKNLVYLHILALLFSGCFSSRDVEYDSYDDCYVEEIVIIETPPPIYIVPSPRPPQYNPIVEKPHKKLRTNGEGRRGLTRRTRNKSYSSRKLHKNSVSTNRSSNNNRHIGKKRIGKRR